MQTHQHSLESITHDMTALYRMAAFYVQGEEVHVIVGGMANGEWQPLVLVVAGLQQARFEPTAKVDVHVAETDISAPLRLRDPAVCKVSGPATCLLVGADDHQTALLVWAGQCVPSQPGSLSPYQMKWTPLQAPCAACARSQHTATYHAASDSVIIFGGYSSKEGHLGDVIVIDAGRGESWQPGDSGQLPAARRGHVAAIIGDQMIVFGGATPDGMLQDTICLNLTTWVWELVRRTVHCFH
jgi:Galactose oxidase, central domain